MKILSVIAGIVGILIGYSLVTYVFDGVFNPRDNKVSQEQVEKVFSNSCTNSYNSISDDNYGEFYCTCVIRNLKQMYGEQFLITGDFLKRINTTGYSSEETDMMATCLPQEYEYQKYL